MRSLFKENLRPAALLAGAVLLSAAYYTVRELAVAGFAGFPLDDSWIHLVFARNIAHGDFFSYNPHHPVAGSTSPLWTIILGIGFAVVHNPIVIPKALGILLNIVSALFTWKIAETIGVKRFPAIVIAIMAICSPHLVWASLSGMEVSCYVALCLATLYAYLQFNDSRDWKFYIPWVMCGVSVWARPELGTEAVFFGIHQLLLRLQRRTQKKDVRNLHSTQLIAIIPIGKLILGGAAFAITVVPFLLLNEALSSTLLPLTFLAKTNNGLAGLLEAGDYGEILSRSFQSLYLMAGHAMKWLWLQDNLFVAIAATMGFVMIAIAAGRRRISDPASAVLLLLAVHLFLYGPIRSVVTGTLDFGQWGRYAAHMTPIMMLFGGSMLAMWIEKRVRTVEAARMAYIAIAAACTLVLAVYYSSFKANIQGHQGSLEWDVSFLHEASTVHIFMFVIWAVAVAAIAMWATRGKFSLSLVQGFILLQLCGYTVVENYQAAEENAWNVRNINDTQVLIGNWLQSNTPAGSVYATNDIGAMAYYATNDTIVDVIGLVEPKISMKLKQTQSTQETVLWTLNTWRPGYFVCFDEWFPKFIHDARQAGAVERVKSFPIVNNITCGGPGIRAMNIYRVHPDQMATIPVGTMP